MIRVNVQNKWRSDADRKIAEFVSMIVESGAIAIWSDAKRFHKFRNRTGELERSIRIEKSETGIPEVVKYSVMMGKGESSGIRGMENSGVGAGGSDKASYAVYVELGTRKMPPYPALRPALERNRMSIIRSAKQIFDKYFRGRK